MYPGPAGTVVNLELCVFCVSVELIWTQTALLRWTLSFVSWGSGHKHTQTLFYDLFGCVAPTTNNIHAANVSDFSLSVHSRFITELYRGYRWSTVKKKTALLHDVEFLLFV